MLDAAHVVEQHAALQRRQRLAAQVAQQAVADAAARHRAQAFLGLLDGLVEGFRCIQRDRIEAGEPADRATRVQPLEQRLAAVPFEGDQRAGLAAPGVQRTGQGGQQQVVDLRPVGRRGFAQQRLAAGGVELPVRLPRHGLHRPALGIGAGQRRRRRQAAPERQFGIQRVATCERLQALGPLLEAQALLAEVDGQAVARLAVGGLQVFQQDTPGHPVHHQVMDHQQQALAAFRQLEMHRPQQRTLRQVEAGLGLVAGGGQSGQIHLPLPQHLCVTRLAVALPPLAVVLAGERHAQRIVVFEQGLQRLAQRRRIERFARFEQQRLVPVLAAAHGLFEERVLDRRQRDIALRVDGCHRRRTALQQPGDLGQFGDALALEDLPWR
ncbi:hypothetical protein D3C78_1026430 [compost metagenome]